MFNRLRYTARVLSPSFPEKPKACDTPDITFEHENPIEVSRVSLVIGSLLGVFAVSLGVGEIVYLIASAFPKVTTHSATTISAIAAGLLAILWQHVVNGVHARLLEHLKVGERIAPYFGRKITRTIQALRG